VLLVKMVSRSKATGLLAGRAEQPRLVIRGLRYHVHETRISKPMLEEVTGFAPN
jgi:hypothetical protein